MYRIFYYLIQDKELTQWSVTCERIEEARLIWDTLHYIRNDYRMLSLRP